MNKSRLAIFLGLLLVLALTVSAFAGLVVTYTTSDDAYSEYNISDSEARIAEATTNSLIDNGAFTQWGMGLGPSDPWTFWRDDRAGWTAGRLHEFDLALPANPEGINNAMGWFIQHSGAKEGGYYAGAYQQLTRIPVAGLYYVSISTTAFEDGRTGPYNSIAWYAISDSASPSGVEDWRELFPDQFVCANGDGVCNYVGRDETVQINPGQYFHLMVGRKFPEFFGWTMFVIDDISIVAADGTLNTTNGFYNWCNGNNEDFKVHEDEACRSYTEIHWDPDQTR
ncbi:MAG: hypothetical protein R6X18_17195 [Chloroflexota bacterium]|jgi:hypothetical protein